MTRLGVPSGAFRQEERNVPIVTVQQSPRDLDAKRRLVAGITQAFVDAYGVPSEHVQVFIAEFDHEHWAKAGVLAGDAAA
jgi:4-oxalocrotonate tautomerase